MDRMLPPDPTLASVVYSVVAPRKVAGRGTIGVACALGAMYLAFAVGAPWLLHDAPPDTYAVMATKATCAAAHDRAGHARCVAHPTSAR